MGDDERIELAERLARIEERQEQMAVDIASLRATLVQVLNELKQRADSATGMQLECARRGEQATQIARLIDDHERRLKETERWIPAVKIMVWIGGALGLSVIALIWGILTHSVQLVVK